MDRAADDKLRSLLHAVIAIAEDLDLQTALHHITEVAASLVDAEYGALGVIDEDGQGLAQFIVVGVDEAMTKRIGSLPAGHGVLGKLITDPHPLRLEQLASHPESFGFPPHHPPMNSFLGVPIRVRDLVFGNLYLTQKRGGGAFDEQDEAVVLGLAAAAGVAIENARLFSESRQRERWLVASSEVSTALLSGTDPEEVLSLVAREAREVTGGALAFVALPASDGRLLIEVAEGEGAGANRGRILERSELLEEVIAYGEARHIPACELSTAATSGNGLAVPLAGAGGQSRGVLVVTGLPGADTAVAVRALTSFAGQAAVALELAERRREAERFAVFEDRDRIARDLHDLVIQRLFATGMHLEGASRLIHDRPDEAHVRVRRAVDDLDGTIRELRSTIYGLQAPADARESLRALLLQVVDGGAEQLGFAPSLRMDGLLDTLVSSAAAEHLLAAVREALSNAARHAAASAVTVTVAVRDDELVLDVVDNGVGISASGRRSGLTNLETRAVELGGTLSTTPAAGGGTTLRWRVPLSAAPD